MQTSTARTFNFPVSTLLRDAKRLLGSLTDATVGPAVVARLTTPNNPAPATTLETQIDVVEKGGTDQSGAFGDVNALTQAQALAFTELERLTSAARRSGSLAYPPGDARLRSEFQVGIHDRQDLASELDRARKVLAAVTKYAGPVAEHGWIAADTAALAAVIDTLAGADEVQEAAKGKKKGATANRNAAANTLYKLCLSTQNAARLAYPNTKADATAVVEARARYLLDEFPPTTGASAGDPPPPPVIPPLVTTTGTPAT